MAGRWRKRGDRIELRAYAGRDALTGKKRYATRTMPLVRKREADKALAAFVAEFADGNAGSAPPARRTVGELLECWFEARSGDWSPGTACVVAAWLGVRIKDASPDTSSISTKTLAALATAAFAAALGWLLDWRPRWGRGGLARRRLQSQFTSRFPAQPQAPAEGIAAWQAVDQAFFHSSDQAWGYAFRRDLFTSVKAAIDAGGYVGGPAWMDAEPPATRL